MIGPISYLFSSLFLPAKLLFGFGQAIRLQTLHLLGEQSPLFVFDRKLSPAGALLVTKRELVLISEEKAFPRQHAGDLHKFGGIITYFPLARLEDFRLSQHERFDVLALQVQAMHGGEKLEIIFPSDHEKAISEAMEQVLVHAGGAL